MHVAATRTHMALVFGPGVFPHFTTRSVTALKTNATPTQLQAWATPLVTE
jgi:hypothetical protein